MPKEPHAKPSDMAKKKGKPDEPVLPPPPPPNKPQQCHFWVARKRRYCSLPAKKTNKFCGEHLIHQDADSMTDRRRVPCPYDPSHTVFERELENHMETKCNARPRSPESYHTLNVNCTLPLSDEELAFQKNIHLHKQIHAQPWIMRVQLADLPRNELDQLVNKIQRTYTSFVTEPMATSVLTHAAAECKREHVKHTKHLDQQSSLLGHMAKAGMLDDKNACFIEFGAGKGETSAFLKAALAEENGESSFVLVDRKLVRNKVDNSLLGLSEKKSTVQRVTIDIKDLELSKVQALFGEEGKSKKKVVALSKHLCGSATDITLKCLMNYVQHERSEGNSNPISGIIIALCCHQLCRYEMYPNTKYLDAAGFDKMDFARLCKMSSWAICGQRAKDDNDTAAEDDEHADLAQEEEDADQTTGHYSGRDHHEREQIGYQCKRVLDMGRVRYLQEYGFKAYLVYYVEPTTSLENCALIAVPEE